MWMSWPMYLAAIVVVILGLMALDLIAPQAVSLLVLALVLGVAVTHPTFSAELVALSKRLRGG